LKDRGGLGRVFIAIHDRPPILVTPLEKSFAPPRGRWIPSKNERGPRMNTNQRD
jgi:hypothetical protein